MRKRVRMIFRARAFLNEVHDLFNYIPYTFHFNEEIFIEIALEAALNNTYFDARHFARTCFQYGNEVTDIESEMILDIIENKFIIMSDMLKETYSQYSHDVDKIRFIKLLKVKWESKSLVILIE